MACSFLWEPGHFRFLLMFKTQFGALLGCSSHPCVAFLSGFAPTSAHPKKATRMRIMSPCSEHILLVAAFSFLPSDQDFREFTSQNPDSKGIVPLVSGCSLG